MDKTIRHLIAASCLVALFLAARPVHAASQTAVTVPPAITLPLGGGVNIDLVLIPADTFIMGSPTTDTEALSDEFPQHQVTLKQAFYMGKYEVTQTQCQAVIGNNPSYFTGDLQRPVEQVSWNDAQAFCQQMSTMTGKTVRLPTEAEWEYACRAGTTMRYYTGDDDASINAAAWYTDNSGSGITNQVGQKTPNAFGLYDMMGNVWEWAEDDWHDNYVGAPADGSAWVDTTRAGLRVLRGGSWGDYAWYCRSARRSNYNPVDRSNICGFRVVVNVPKTIIVPDQYATIQAAVDAATAGDTIHIRAGHYALTQTVTVNKNVTIEGEGADVTILEAVTPFTDASGYGFAPLLYVPDLHGSVTIRDMHLTNTAGDGIFANEVTGTLRIERNVITGCSAYGTLPPYDNACGIGLNNADDGYGVAWVVNNTIVNCRNGVLTNDWGTIYLYNNLIVGSDYGVIDYNVDAWYWTYNDVFNSSVTDWFHQDNYQYTGEPMPAPAGNMSADPLFAAGTYFLSAGSPCINAGNPDSQFNDPDGSRNDIGAFPFQPPIAKRIVGYFQDGDINNDHIDYGMLTQVNYTFLYAKNDGTLDPSNINSKTLGLVVKAAHNAGAHISISVQCSDSPVFHNIANSPSALDTFCDGLVQFCAQNNLDGTDLDWEAFDNVPNDTPNPTDYGILIDALRGRMVSGGLLSVAVSASEDKQISPQSVSELDWIAVMDYDLIANSSAPYQKSIDYFTKWWTYLESGGASKSKLLMGVPFYGRAGNCWCDGSCSMCSQTESYQNIIDTYISTYGTYPSPDKHGDYSAALSFPLRFDGSTMTWGFNGIVTIQDKAHYVIDNGYGGMMIWSLGQDHCTQGKYDKTSLLPAIMSVVTQGLAPTCVMASYAAAVYSPADQSITLKADVLSASGIVSGGAVMFQVMQVATNVGQAVPGTAILGRATANYLLPGGTRAGTYSILASYSERGAFQADWGMFQPSVGSGTLTISKATPVLTWPQPADITYPTPLSTAKGAQLDAQANVPGVSTYTPPPGTVLGAGSGITLCVCFTPTDTTNYVGASKTVQINVLKCQPAIFWNPPAGIIYGTPLSKAQLNASINPNVPGLSYSPDFGTVLNAGTTTLTANFMPVDMADYVPSAQSVIIRVSQATPNLTWSKPAPMIYGTPLSDSQLDAQHDVHVPGTFLYSPKGGTILNPGTYTLYAYFTPTDRVNYASGYRTVTVTVLPKPAP